MVPSSIVLPAPISVPGTSVPQTIDPAVGTGSGSNLDDVNRLKALVAGATPPANAPMDVAPVSTGAPATIGDSILQGIAKFNSSYQESMGSIKSGLQELGKMDPGSLENLDDLIGLQLDVTRWSMAVMGVDNASKAGTNTIKELSRGG